MEKIFPNYDDIHDSKSKQQLIHTEKFILFVKTIFSIQYLSFSIYFTYDSFCLHFRDLGMDYGKTHTPTKIRKYQFYLFRLFQLFLMVLNISIFKNTISYRYHQINDRKHDLHIYILLSLHFYFLFT